MQSQMLRLRTGRQTDRLWLDEFEFGEQLAAQLVPHCVEVCKLIRVVPGRELTIEGILSVADLKDIPYVRLEVLVELRIQDLDELRDH